MNTEDLLLREAVRETISKYTHAGDRFDLETLAACFTEDGTLLVDGKEPVSGRSAIVDALGANRRHRVRATEPGFFVRHFVTNIRFESVTTSEICASAYFLVLTPGGIDHWGRYRDVFVPGDGHWLIRHRRVRVDAHSPTSWLSDAFSVAGP